MHIIHFIFILLCISAKNIAQNIHLVNGNYLANGKFRSYDNLHIRDGLFSLKKTKLIPQ
jgi:hypothetical protein